MKKPKTTKLLKKPKLPPVKLRRPAKTAEEKVSEALSDVPRITNETLGEHREEMLSSARKYIYPLQHSKHHVVRISISLFIAVVLIFFGACALSLYKLQSTGGFIYDVTRIVPFPVAKAGKSWVSYESYLFELRRNMHYYRTQQNANFSSKSGQSQLARLKQQAMSEVVQDAYVKQLANQHHVSVSNQEVTNEINLLRAQNRLGNSDRVFRDVLNEFWGWNEADFRRSLKEELLQQAVVAKLDTAANARAQSALNQLAGGADFATVAQQMSDDAGTKGNGGRYPEAITPNDANISPAVTAELFKLQPNQVSTIINTGYTLEIVKVLDKSGNSLHAAHIQFNLKPITTYTAPLQAKEPPHKYIKLPPAPTH
ncbi:MAG TPA: SurA N-terminal domain-containing protein [Candidatus Saccharimonadales bacterium]|nr:SurA N-terminal domain-containing protein [Candidatus Saccharimonadales bacterium]